MRCTLDAMSSGRLVAAFVAVQVVLAGYFLDTPITPNPTSRALAAICLVDRGTPAIDGYEGFTTDESRIGRHVYSDKAPLSALVVAPLYAAAEHVPWVAGSTERRIEVAIALGALACGTLPFVLLATLCWVAIRDRRTAVPPVLLATLPLYGSFLFVFAGAYFGHLLAGMWLLAAYLALRKDRLFTAGVLVGLGCLTEYPVALAALVWAVQLLVVRRSVRAPARLVAGFAPAALAIVAYNLAITGTIKPAYSYVSHASFAAMRHHLGFGWPRPRALWGLLFSPFRGAFFYAPVLYLFAYRWLRGTRARTWLRHPLPPLVAAYVVLIASYYMWWGGWSYGPRLLIPVAMPVFYEGIVLLASAKPAQRGTRGVSRPLFYVVTGLGLAFAVLAKATAGFMLPDALHDPIPGYLVPFVKLGWFDTGNLASWLGAPAALGGVLWLVLAALGLGGLVWLSASSSGSAGESSGSACSPDRSPACARTGPRRVPRAGPRRVPRTIPGVCPGPIPGIVFAGLNFGSRGRESIHVSSSPGSSGSRAVGSRESLGVRSVGPFNASSSIASTTAWTRVRSSPGACAPTSASSSAASASTVA